MKPDPTPSQVCPVRVLVCVGPRCDAEGRGRALLTALREVVATAFPNPAEAELISLGSRDCLRSCTREPIVRIEPSGEVFSSPQPADLVRLLREALSAPAITRVKVEGRSSG